MNTATITLPAASGRQAIPAATRLTAALRHLIHRMHVRMRADMIQGLSAPNPCYLAKGGEK